MSGTDETQIVTLASVPGQGKTTTALLLERHFREQGMRVACLQMNKGQYDVSQYLANGCDHYTIPLEATKNRAAFEAWVPRGYDLCTFEVTCPYSPFGAPYLNPLERYNEIVAFESSQDWRTCVRNQMKRYWKQRPKDPEIDIFALWDMTHDKEVQRVITKTPGALAGPCVDTALSLRHPEQFAYDTIKPRMTLPRSDASAMAVGAFPAEFWSIFPRLRWYRFDYASFLEEYRHGKCDVAIIGACLNERLKIRDRPGIRTVFCYQPSVYHNLARRPQDLPLKDDFREIMSAIRDRPVGGPICTDGSAFSGYNNRFWTYQPYPDREMIWREENIVFCNGWILPQYLIRDGFLEVA